VQPFLTPGPRRQVTFEGAREPVWNRNGRELFFRSGLYGSMDPSRSDVHLFDDQLFAVPFDLERGIATAKPARLFRGQYAAGLAGVPGYDVMPDGRRFIMVKPSGSEIAPLRLNVVVNWADELVRRVPARR